MRRASDVDPTPSNAALGLSHVPGKDLDNVPLCVGCLGLLLSDPAAFWQGMPKEQE